MEGTTSEPGQRAPIRPTGETIRWPVAACNNGAIGSFRHPLFARAYARLSVPMEQEVGRYRAELVGNLSGDILEIGCGNGMNFAHYGPDAVVTALEPEPYLRARAVEAAGRSIAKVEVVDGNAAELAFDAESFDVVVTCLVLCSVGEQDRALAEIAKVLKPTGSLVFLEHVRSDSRTKGRIQVALDSSRIWPLVAGGCHCSCQTIEGMEKAGFTVTSRREVKIGPDWLHTNPHITGKATLNHG